MGQKRFKAEQFKQNQHGFLKVAYEVQETDDFQFRDIRSKAITDAEDQGINPIKLSGNKTS